MPRSAGYEPRSPTQGVLCQVVPVRQWVLTLPPRIRYLLAWDHALCRAVVGVFMRTVLGFLRRRARETEGIADARSGVVVIVQRFGAALNTNIHAHAMVLDGVFAEDTAGGLRLHAGQPPTDVALDRVLATIARRVRRLLVRRGMWEGDPWAESAPVLAAADVAALGREVLRRGVVQVAIRHDVPVRVAPGAERARHDEASRIALHLTPGALHRLEVSVEVRLDGRPASAEQVFC